MGRSQGFICARGVHCNSARATGSELGLRWGVRVLTVSVLATCLLMISLPRVSGVSSQDVATAITTAEKALQAAFVNVSDTERAGVNVSSLLSRLDEVGAALTMAETEANSGNYSEAMSQAAAGEALAEGVSREAIALKNGAGDSFSILIIFLSSFAVAGVFLVILALTWLLFKRYYFRKLSESRPGVVT